MIAVKSDPDLSSKAEKAQLSDFADFAKGDELVFFLGNADQDRITWRHDRVERDLVYGSAKLESGLALPVDCYLENVGGALLFDVSAFDGRVDAGIQNLGGVAFLSMPLPSQLSTPWRPSEGGPRYGTFSARERAPIERLMADLKDKGFVEGPGWRGGGFDDRLPIWEASLIKQGCDVHMFARKERQGFLKAPRYDVSVTDMSHRPAMKQGTGLVSEDGLSLDEAVSALSTGVDLAWSRSR